MNILVTNDDGIDAPGIKALAAALSDLGNIFVVAPDRNHSGASSSLTLGLPLCVNERAPNWLSVQGTPTDCVHMAITGLLDVVPDIVVSGVNAGANLGDDVWYSGTVAAAMEGRFLKYPAVAVSLVGKDHHHLTHFDVAAGIARQVVSGLFESPLADTAMLNINVPDLPSSEQAGLEVTRLGERHCAAPLVKDVDPRGLPMYWVGAAGDAADASEGTDFWAIKKRSASVTPLHVDLTKYSAFDALSQWVGEAL